MKHNELVARLATSNISTEDFSYLTTVLMEIKTCKNCRYMRGNDKLGFGLRTMSVCLKSNSNFIGVELDFGCNHFVSTDTKSH